MHRLRLGFAQDALSTIGNPCFDHRPGYVAYGGSDGCLPQEDMHGTSVEASVTRPLVLVHRPTAAMVFVQHALLIAICRPPPTVQP